MTEEEAIAALDWEPSLDCELTKHALSEDGCRAAEHGEYLVEDAHKRHDSGFLRRLVICQSKQIWFRSVAHKVIRCDECGARMTVGERFRFLGRVADLPVGDAS